MRRLAILIVLLVGALAAAGQPRTLRPAPAPATGPPLEGIWRGELAGGSVAVPLSFSLVALTGGTYFAALDVPAQKLTRVPADVQQRGDSVRLLVSSLQTRFLGALAAGGTELRGVWVHAGRRVPLLLTHSPLPSLSGPATRLAPPYQEEEVAFTNAQGRLKLAGTFTSPGGTGPYPTVVLVSDVGEQDRDGQAPGEKSGFRLLAALADYFTRHGFAVLRFDDRGVGRSEGRNSQAVPAQRAADVQAALNYLRTRPEVDLLRLGVVGHGEGASLALLVASEPLPPAFVVGLGAYGLSGYDLLLHQYEAGLPRKLPPAQLEQRLQRQRTLYDLIRYTTNLPQTQAIVANLLRQAEPTRPAEDIQRQTAALLTPWSRAFLTFNPLESLPNVQCPVLLVSGQADEQAPPAVHLPELEHELRANGNRRVTTYRPVGVNHLLQPPRIQWTMLDGEMKPVLSPAVAELLMQWLTRQVTPPGKK